MVSIFTYRDERKLFAVIGAVIVAALIALVQIDAARNGRPSAISIAVDTVFSVAQGAVANTVGFVRGAASGIADAPRLGREVAGLRDDNRRLTRENAALREAVAQNDELQALLRAQTAPDGILARIIAYDPESQSRVVSIDKGWQAGVRVDAGVVNDDGVVGRVAVVEPFTAQVLLLTDPASKLPAIVQRGRWWGIATGANTRLQLQYVSQDARLRAGDPVVTGEGRSFHTGMPIGRIGKIYHAEGALYQTATIEPAVAFGRLERVLVLHK